MSGESAEPWRRTDPRSFVVGTLTLLRRSALPLLAVAFGTRAWEGGFATALLVLAAIIAANALGSYLSWRKLRYCLGETDIRVESGLLSRAARAVPYERIQDVSLEQALLPRLFGLVEVRFETGAGGKDELKLAYVGEAEGEALRETVRARKMSEADGAGEIGPSPETAGPVALFAMDGKRLLIFGIFEFSLVIFAILAGVAQQFDFLLPFDPWDLGEWEEALAGQGAWLTGLGVVAQLLGVIIATLLLGLVGLATGIGRTVARDYGFCLEETAKGFRRRRGLFTRSDVVMPVHRVQALKITTGIIRRRFGWWGLEFISLAQDSGSASHSVAPFARMDEIEPIADAAGFSLPGDIEWLRPSPHYRLDRAILAGSIFGMAALAAILMGIYLAGLGLALAGVFLAARQHFLWRYECHALDDRQIHVRRGWLSPSIDIASRVRIQSVEISRGPIGRRRGYADIQFGLAGGRLFIQGAPLADALAIRRAVLTSIASVDFSDLPR